MQRDLTGEEMAALYAERNALRAEVAALRAALQAVEYADMEERCPLCASAMCDGHRSDCQRQVALGLSGYVAASATTSCASTATANQTYTWLPGDVWTQYCAAVDGAD